MKKSILFDVEKGVRYSPAFDSISVAFGCNVSSVLGKMIVYAGMANRVCQAAQDTIAFELGLSVGTVNVSIKKCEDENFIKDHTPNLLNKVHTYSILENKIIEFDRKYERAMTDFYRLEQDIILKLDNKSVMKYITTSEKTKKFRRQYIKIVYKDNSWYFNTVLDKTFIKLDDEANVSPRALDDESNKPVEYVKPEKIRALIRGLRDDLAND